jgi:hypothetical protein
LNYYIAQLYIKQNKYNEAIKQLELSLNIEKNNDLSKEIKAEIDKINN